MNTPVMLSPLERAIDTARQHIPIQQKVVRPEYWTGWTITLDARGQYRVYSDSAWVEQHESLLPWSKPAGTPVGHVDLDGAYTEVTASE